MSLNSHNKQFSGYLYKWTNYVNGYQKRWFVLSNGVLSYFINESKIDRICRGSITITTATIMPTSATTFTISSSSGLIFHINALTQNNAQAWLDALNEYSYKPLNMDDHIFSKQSNLMIMAKNIEIRAEELNICKDIIARQWTALRDRLAKPQFTQENIENNGLEEKVTLFQITCGAFVNQSSKFVSLIQKDWLKIKHCLDQYNSQQCMLESMVKAIARKEADDMELLNGKEKIFADGDHDSGEESFYDALGSLDVYQQKNINLEVNVCTIDVKKEKQNNKNPVPGPSNLDAIVRTVKDKNEKLNNKNPVPGSSNLNVNALTLKVKNEQKNNKGPVPVASNLDVNVRSVKEQNNKQNNKDVVPGSSLDVSVRTVHVKNEKLSDKDPVQVPSKLDVRTVKDKNEKQNKKGPVAGHSNLKVRKNEEQNKVDSQSKVIHPHRECLPKQPTRPLQIWTILKQLRGGDITRLSMPVEVAEPISMLQRLTEDFQYSYLLDQASTCTDFSLQLAYVAVFAATNYASSGSRTTKPFNPLLGETFEMDRLDELGWRCLSEQVSHHPPIAAQHCQGKGWTLWKTFSISSKFKGNYLQINPVGITHLEFHDTKQHYTWDKVTTTVNNIILGTLGVDHFGIMTVTNQNTGNDCQMTFTQCCYFSNYGYRKVEGTVMTKKGTAKWLIKGRWDTIIQIVSCGTKKEKVIETWEASPPNPGMEHFYNFSKFACQLNELEEGVAPTDSRRRPDQRLMEEGKWPEANAEKIRLERKQRLTKSLTEALKDHTPTWFTLIKDANGGREYVFNDQYWICKGNQDWSRCPKIF